MKALFIGTTIACATALSGCGGPAYVEGGYYSTIDSPPPRPLVEVAPPSPGDRYVWVDGYWRWTGAQYDWVRGRWALAPRVGYVWQPAGYIAVGGHYRFAPGRWVHRSRYEPRGYVHVRSAPRRGRVYRAVPRGQIRARGRGDVRVRGTVRGRGRVRVR